MAYEYDVFISYRRKRMSQRWLEELFLPLFKDYLEEELGGRTVKIFRDEGGIVGGADWANQIKRALATSKCLVPIFLPSYFHSEWCTRELAIIHHRQKACGFNTVENPNGLIVPLKIRDGHHFPAEAKRLETLNCNPYFRVGSGVEATELYVNLQDTLLNWVQAVAQAVESAPEWKPEWLTSEWLDIPTDDFLINEDDIDIAPPQL